MSSIAKCRSSEPYKNNDAVIVVSRRNNQVRTLQEPVNTFDPTAEGNRLDNRFNNINYYYGTKAIS